MIKSVFIVLIASSHIWRQCHCQLNTCLRPSGCSSDECCFNIVPKTGDVCHRILECDTSKRDIPNQCCLNARVATPRNGQMYGYALLLDDPYQYRDNGNRFLQIWLGVPYAMPPTRGNNLRFVPTERPRTSSRPYDATYYRPSCPQSSEHLSQLTNATTDEDCLYLNVFVTNTTVEGAQSNLYPILVFLHGGQHAHGSAQHTPGHVLAQTNIMVITVQYRLNAFGYLRLRGTQAKSNYGLYDQVRALEYIRDEIQNFRGDATRVTLMGHGSAAGDVALHTMSPLSGLAPSPLFHRTIWLSGSDLMWGGFANSVEEAERYGQELAVRAACTSSVPDEVLDCLRQRSDRELAGAASETVVHEQGWLGRPWSPTVDDYFIKDSPENIRRAGNFNLRIPVIGGVTWDEGAHFTVDLPGVRHNASLSSELFRSRVMNISKEVFPHDEVALADAIQFEYTYWADPSNDSARLQMLRDLYSDRHYGSGLIRSLRYSADTQWQRLRRNATQMFVFKYRSDSDPKAKYMGAYHGSELQYIFGLPHLRTANWTEFGLKQPAFEYADLDINMTDYMMYFISSFVISGNATPQLVRNFTWDTFRWNNRTYFELNLQDDFQNDFNLHQDFRTYHYAFWNNFFPTLANRPARLTTIMPTAAYLAHYTASTFALSGILAFVLIVIAALSIVLCRLMRSRGVSE